MLSKVHNVIALFVVLTFLNNLFSIDRNVKVMYIP